MHWCSIDDGDKNEYAGIPTYIVMTPGGIFQLIANDGKQDRMVTAQMILNQRITAIENRRGLWEQLHARFVLMLFERRLLLPMYHYWALRRGHGDFACLPLDVRRIIIGYSRRWYDRAVPLEEIAERCERAGDEPLASHVRGWIGGRQYRDAIYREGDDEWWR